MYSELDLDEELHHFDALNDSNYYEWQSYMRAQLRILDRWDIVTGEDACPVRDPSPAPAPEVDTEVTEQAVAAWQRRDAEARFVIARRLDASQRRRVVDCATAKEKWDALRHEHLETNVGFKTMKVFREMAARKYVDGTSMRAHTAAPLTDGAKLGQLGMPVPDTFLGMFMLLSVSGEDARTVLLAVDQGEELEATRIASCLEASRARGRGRNADSDGARSHRTADGDLAAGREFEN